MPFESSIYLSCAGSARVGYSVHGQDLLAQALFEGGVLWEKKGAEIRALLGIVENSRKERVTLESVHFGV